MKRVGWILAGALAATLIVLLGVRMDMGKNTIRNYHMENLGEQVYIFKPTDDMQEIQKIVDDIFAKQETNQFGKERYALCFLPGDYPELDVKVGYYTQVIGLGKKPTDTRIGKVECDARWLGDDPDNHNALCNFWRSVENLEVTGNTMWAVSQATDMRRVQVDGALYLHDNYGWASGGFLANSNITSMVDSGSQQQWLSRNNTYRAWMGQNWNIVFCGDTKEGLPTGTWPLFSYTRADGVDNMREKPYITYDPKDGLELVCPALRNAAEGYDWDSDVSEERISLDDCYIATPDDSAMVINEALAAGKNIIFTPGIYELEEALQVTRDDTILLGIGLATLEPVNGNVCVETKASGVTIAGLLFDAGTVESEYLVHIGDAPSDEAKPILLADVYCRVGGARVQDTAVKTAVVVDADGVVGDNLWIWRADHGDGVGWNKNTSDHGIEINGDNVTMVALMVEHFQKEQTIWRGQGGRCIMYQSEVPYDIPEGMASSSFVVEVGVTSFYGTGIGIYLYNRDAAIPLESAMVVPDAPDVRIEHVIDVMLGNSHPGIHHVINSAGGSVLHTGEIQKVLYYCNGEWK